MPIDGNSILGLGQAKPHSLSGTDRAIRPSPPRASGGEGARRADEGAVAARINHPRATTPRNSFFVEQLFKLYADSASQRPRIDENSEC